MSFCGSNFIDEKVYSIVFFSIWQTKVNDHLIYLKWERLSRVKFILISICSTWETKVLNLLFFITMIKAKAYFWIFGKYILQIFFAAIRLVSWSIFHPWMIIGRGLSSFSKKESIHNYSQIRILEFCIHPQCCTFKILKYRASWSCRSSFSIFLAKFSFILLIVSVKT